MHEPGRDCAVDLCNCNCDCIFGKDFYTSGNFAYYLLNSVFMLFVAIALAYLMGTIAPNRDALTGIANIILWECAFWEVRLCLLSSWEMM